MIDLFERRRRAILAVALASLTLIVFSGVRHFDFVNYDDPDYVAGNPLVLSGLTLSGVATAFGDVSTGSWMPLTLISHMVDVSLFGTGAGWHHLNSALIHALSVALLFWLLSTATGSLWRSAFVAVVFAVHPLRVESVAWIAERKDVLCGLFMVGTALLHVQYVRALPAPPPQGICQF